MSARIFYWPVKIVLLIAFGILFYDFGLSIAGEEVHMGPVAGAVGVVILLFLCAGKSPLLVSRLFPLGMLVGVGLNVAFVRTKSLGATSPIAPHATHRILDLARVSRHPTAQTTFSLYYYMHDNLRGRKLVVYSDSVFDEGYLQRISRLNNVEVRTDYPWQLTVDAEEKLRARSADQFTDADGREFIFVHPRSSEAAHEEYLVLHFEGRHYIVHAAEDYRDSP